MNRQYVKVLTAVNHALGSINVSRTSLILTEPTRDDDPACFTPRAFATVFSSGVRVRSLSGESGKKKNATGTIASVGKPSTRNRMRQFARLA